MRFVHTHLTSHHFFHKPHKWFLAFLISPIHFLELHYKKQYHLKFEHARKLFLFDMVLLVSIILLVGTTLFWRLYNPTITDLIHLSISSVSSESNSGRIKSGQYIAIHVNAKNNSDTVIREATIRLALPDGFVLTSSTSNIIGDGHIGELQPGEEYNGALFGYLYGTPNEDIHAVATLSYTQSDRDTTEHVIARTIIILRDSTLQTTITTPQHVLNHSTVPISIDLYNSGERPIESIHLPLVFPEGMGFSPLSSTTGTYTNVLWQVDALDTNTTATLLGNLTINLPDDIEQTSIDLVPELAVGQIFFKQVSATHQYAVLSPRVVMSANWSTDTNGFQPGNTYPFTIRLQNTGTIDLEHLTLSLPLPTGIIDSKAFATKNNVAVSQGIAVIREQTFGTLSTLRTGESITLTLQVPILFIPNGGTNLTLTLSPTLNAYPVGITSSQPYRTVVTSSEKPIGTQLLLKSEVRYYTKEGDQLGRGPLPPITQKETKYWALLTVTNNTSALSPVSVSAKLPPYVTWTGKSSVTNGNNITYHPNNRTVTWSFHTLHAHDIAQAGFELAIIPTENQKGTTPTLLTNITATGQDSYINTTLTRSTPPLDMSLPTDSIAREKGVVVQ